jgi:vacuolar-type H+-ATPase subunit I/STV1
MGYQMEMENQNSFQVESSNYLTEKRNALINDLSNAISDGTNPSHIIRIRQQINETDDKIFSAIVCETKVNIEEQIKIKNESLSQIAKLHETKAEKWRRLIKALDHAKLRQKKLTEVQLQIEYKENTLQSARQALSEFHKKLKLLKDEKINEVMKKYE